MPVSLNGGHPNAKAAAEAERCYSLMPVSLNGGASLVNRLCSRQVLLVDACITEWRNNHNS